MNKEIDSHICPKCGNDNWTYTYDSWIHEHGYNLMHCDNHNYDNGLNIAEGCGTYYRVYYNLIATKVEVEEGRR